ncbi:MAG: hypothetical protein OXU61_02325 [Gammaproteobacteria bacterium]|nr:hypothetical protein [Gammaproteobacteria bacterium]
MKFSAGEVVHILLDKQRHLGLVCEEQPLRVRESKVFIVDTNKLSHPDDLKADDLGSWKNDGQHSRWVKVKQMGGCVTKLEFCSGKPTNNPNAYRLHRHYFVHHSNSQFKRKIAYLSGMKRYYTMPCHIPSTTIGRGES